MMRIASMCAFYRMSLTAVAQNRSDECSDISVASGTSHSYDPRVASMLALPQQVTIEYHRHAANQEPAAWRHGDRVRRDFDQAIFGQRLERPELGCEIFVERDGVRVFDLLE